VEQYCFTGSNEFQDLQARTTERSGLPEVQPTDLAAIIYSSGTTARPKGVMHTHATLLGTAEIICRSLQEVNATSFLEPGATVLVMPPMTHVSGLSTLIPGIALAKTLVLLPRFDPDAALDTFAQHRCTLAVGLPLMYKLLVEAQLRKQRDLSSASYWIVAGDSTPMLLLETFERVCGKPLIECHAMTEALPNTWNHPGRIRRGSMGQPEPLVEILVVGEDALEVPLSEPGEMLVRSPAIMSGYWQDPEATAEVMKDGWLRTGDIVRKDADGYFWFLGRRVEIIKRGGAKISVVEVEAALLEHPEVVEAGVVGLPDEFYGERIAAFASTRSGSALTPGELIAFVRARLAEHKVPEKIEFIDTLPKSSMGKIQRRLLKEMALGRLADAGSAHQPPTPPHESSLTRSTRAV
jgi:long-chain acyl-CoA synthetase